MGEIQFRLIVFGSFDDGIDDVGLPTLLDLLAEEIPHVVCSLARHAARHDGRPAWRQLVEHAYVEIAVERERQGAGNRRGGHHQYIGLGLIGLLHQPEPLQDAEAVLLIDDDEAEPSNSTFSSISAWVPMTSCASPRLMRPRLERFRSSSREPVNRTTR